MRRWLVILIGLLIAVLLASIYSNQNSCSTLEGATFRSKNEVDNFFGGTRHPRISFGNGMFTWATTDVVISGTYQCTSGRITFQDPYGSVPGIGELDPNTGNLHWHGDIYVRVP